QRRQLAAQLSGAGRARDELRAVEDGLAAARSVLADAKQRAEPVLHSLSQAETDLRAAEGELRASRQAVTGSPRWRRRSLALRADDAGDTVAEARTRRDHAERDAAPFLAEIDAAQIGVRQAERNLS